MRAQAVSVDELVESVTPMIWALARDLERPLRRVELEELVADGYLGAVKAAKAFQPDRGLQFVTYARHRIRGEMIDGLRRMDYISRKARQASTQAWQAAELAGREHVDDRYAPPLSLEMPLGAGDDDFVTLGELLPAAGKLLDDAAADFDLIHWVLPYLHGREAEVIQRLYWQDEDYEEIAASWQVTVSRVSQLHGAALHTMRIALIRSGVESVAMVDQVAAVARRKPAKYLDSVERGALFGDLIAFWGRE